MKKYIATLVLLVGFLQNAHAVTTYDPNTNILTLDSVVVGGTQFNNVTVLMGSYSVLGVGSSQPVASAGCTSLTTAKYNLIQLGMTVDQINQILGCKYDPAQVFRVDTTLTYIWHYQDPNTGAVKTIFVFFDANSLRSMSIENGIFKQAVGL